VSSPYLSEIRLFAFGITPHNWAQCAGQILPINQNQALFSLLGTTYGGNGQTTFALPDLRGRVPVSFVNPTYSLGQRAGEETNALVLSTIPSHTHTLDASVLTATPACHTGAANQRGPSGNLPAGEASGVTATYSTLAPDGAMSTAAITPSLTPGNTGTGAGHENRQPYLVLNYCISLVGIFPTH
jgi:microcystin-dependent protein